MKNLFLALCVLVFCIGCDPKAERLYEVKLYKTNLLSMELNLGEKLGFEEQPVATHICRESSLIQQGVLNTRFSVKDVNGDIHWYSGRYRVEAHQIDTVAIGDPRHSRFHDTK